MVVRKAIKMAKQMDVPILGLVENMSYLKCPHCGESVQLFGPSHREEVAKTFGIPVLNVLPVDPQLAELCDSGQVEDYRAEPFVGFSVPGPSGTVGLKS